MVYLNVLIGFVLLLGAAEFLVRGSVTLARRLGISPLVIGMTVVALGTSAPEFVVTINAVMSGAPGLAIGNAVGSNIANILLILGVTGLVAPVVTNITSLKREGTALAAGTLVFVMLCLQGSLGTWAGGLLLLLFASFLYRSYRQEVGNSKEAELHVKEGEEVQTLPNGLWLAIAALVVGMGGILFGADLLVSSSVEIARRYGVSEEIIGLTMIAIGTSLPELAASLMAAIRGHTDLAIGNVVGSNLFNLLGVMGLGAAIAPTPIPVREQFLTFDLWVLVAATAAMLVFMFTGRRLSRAEAAIFLVAYISYIGYLGATGTTV